MAGSEPLLGRAGGSCGTMEPCAFRLEPGLGNGFRWEKLPREQLDRIGAVMGGYGRKGTKAQVATPCPIVCNCPARAVIGSLSLYIQTLRVDFGHEIP